MRTTLFLLHATSCCWLVSGTLSKTDAKKAQKAEAEVRNLNRGFYLGLGVSYVN